MSRTSERAKTSKRLPVVFSRAEVQAVLAYLSGTNHLIASLLYDAGLRLMEAIRLRVKDIDFSTHQLTIREAKGMTDRVCQSVILCAPSGRGIVF